MPGRNINKLYVENGYYHVYSRGVAKQEVFLDDQDYQTFLSLFKRYLSVEPQFDIKKREYPSYHSDIHLLAYCLMPNHFHAFVYQETPEAISQLFKSVITAYGMYFNKKYKRQGPVFQSRYKAALILDDAYYQHISRYIHLNPKDFQNYPYSSLDYYMGKKQASWIDPEPIMEAFQSLPAKYLEFVSDYQEHKQMIDMLKYQLASE